MQVSPFGHTRMLLILFSFFQISHERTVTSKEGSSIWYYVIEIIRFLWNQDVGMRNTFYTIPVKLCKTAV